MVPVHSLLDKVHAPFVDRWSTRPADATRLANFRPVERDQAFLMSPSLRDWLPSDLVRAV